MINEEPLTRPSVALNGLLCLPGCPGVCGTHDLASVKTLSGCHRSPRAFTAAELSTISHTAGSGLNSAVLDLAPNSFKILFETRGHPLTFSGCKLFGVGPNTSYVPRIHQDLFYSPLRSPRIEKFRPSSITSYPSRPGLSVAVYKPSEIILLYHLLTQPLKTPTRRSLHLPVSTRSTLTLTGTLDGTEAEAPDVCAADCNFKKTRASAQRHKFVIDTSHSPSSSSSSIRLLSRRGGRSGWCISMGSLDGEVKERNEYKRIKRGNEKEITHPTPFPTTAQVERKLHATKREMPDRRRYTRTARITPRRSKPVERRRRQVPNVAVVRDFSVKPHRQPHTPATGNAIDEVEVADTATAPATIPFPHLRPHPRRSPSCCSWRRWRRQARPRSNAVSAEEKLRRGSRRARRWWARRRRGCRGLRRRRHAGGRMRRRLSCVRRSRRASTTGVGTLLRRGRGWRGRVGGCSGSAGRSRARRTRGRGVRDLRRSGGEGGNEEGDGKGNQARTSTLAFSFLPSTAFLPPSRCPRIESKPLLEVAVEAIPYSYSLKDKSGRTGALIATMLTCLYAQRTDPAASHDTLPPFPFVSTTIVAVVWDHVDDHHPPRPPLTPELARNRYSTRLEFLLLVLTITIFFFTTTAAIFPLSTATSFLSNHDHRRPPSYHYHHLLLLTIMSTTGADLTSAISECESLVNRAYSVFYALFALVGAVVVALCVGRPPRTTSIKRLRRPPSYHYHHLLLLTIMSTTGADLTSAISECESLVNRAYSVFYALFALVGAVVVALCVGRPPRTTSIKRLRHWIRTSSSSFFTTTTTWLFLLTTTTMNPSRILVAISECTPLVNPSQLVLCTVALAVGAVVVTIRFGRPPRTTSLKRLRPWIRICELRIIARRTYNRLPPTLAEIRALRPLFRVATIAEFPDSYANDGYGATYFNAVVADETLGAYYEGLITAAEFLAEVRVKVGETVNLPNRQQGYNGCNFRQTHFWLCCFYPKKRKAAEKMSHSLFLDDAPRARLPCSCQPGKVHAEYWWLRDLGSFSEVGGRIRDVLALLGQPDLVRELHSWTFNRVVVVDNSPPTGMNHARTLS
ncbi:hypothetical protein C8F04DRAFT_1193827 [Mycena alexandri]|uniref:Uncharacterized protein n=1 Tax=Mycena alexandri TaxID=1745969 RepID=A0AAD6S8B6_9AGAR|nr:hypothetical protein C8F04DRAFT_1193827 [Mycena alexandri]